MKGKEKKQGQMFHICQPHKPNKFIYNCILNIQ